MSEEQKGSGCLLDRYSECCCQCKFRLRALRKPPPFEQFAWACIACAIAEGEDVVYVGDFEHGICELFQHRNSA